MTTIIGLCCMIYIALFGTITLSWILASTACYYMLAIASTVGYHRLFNHATFECNTIFHWVFGLVGCIGLNSSPFHWSVVHSGHHRYSDTKSDPYDNTWKHFFRVKDRHLKVFRNDMRLARLPMHRFLMDNSYTLSIVYLIIVALLFGVIGAVFLYFIPIAMYIVAVGIHTMFSHKDGAARDLFFMEFLIPMAGEWLHGIHHKYAWKEYFSTRWYHFDLGGMIIYVIRTDK